MHKIKKYANRKLYDMTDKKYVSLDRLAELIKDGEEISITDNTTGEDITSSIVSQLIARNKKVSQGEVTTSILIQLLRKGGGTLVDYAKKYSSLWQSAMTMAEDEVDKLVNLLVKDKELSESEGSKLKREIVGYADNLKGWITDNIDQRIKEASGMMNLASKKQILSLTEKIEKLTKKVEKLEKSQGKKGK